MTPFPFSFHENPEGDAAASKDDNLENASEQKRMAQSELQMQGGKIDIAARKYGLKVCASPNAMAD